MDADEALAERMARYRREMEREVALHGLLPVAVEALRAGIAGEAELGEYRMDAINLVFEGLIPSEPPAKPRGDTA